MRKRAMGTCANSKPRYDCLDAQSDQGLRCPLVKSLDTILIECINAKQKPGRLYVCAGNLNMRVLRTNIKQFFILYANCEDQDKHVHPRGLIRTFTIRSYILRYSLIMLHVSGQRRP